MSAYKYIHSNFYTIHLKKLKNSILDSSHGLKLLTIFYGRLFEITIRPLHLSKTFITKAQCLIFVKI